MLTLQSKTNEQITAPEVRVIDADGQNLGVMPRDAALARAREKGLDLILMSAQANPPVCRIMSFDKFRYEQSKKIKEERAKQKDLDPKQVQISIREAKYDLDMKAKRVEGFLGEGRPVTIVMTLRGREKANKDFAREKLAAFIKMITVPHQIAMEPRLGMRGFAMQIVKK